MNEGFTLIELLAVVFIISILTLLTVNIISSTVSNGKNEINEKQILLIEKSAQLWGADNKLLLPDTDSTCKYITLGDLKNDGYLNDTTYDINNMEALSNSLVITIRSTLIEGRISYKYEFNPLDTTGCTYLFGT